MSCLPFECIQVANIWPFRLPLLGQVAKLAGYLSVREMPVEKFVEAGGRLLGQGVSVICFPEGTRSGSSKLGPFHGSAFRLALHAPGQNRAPGRLGQREYSAARLAVLTPGRIAVHKLPAITVDEFASMPIFKIKMLVHDKLQEHLDCLEAAQHEQ